MERIGGFPKQSRLDDLLSDYTRQIEKSIEQLEPSYVTNHSKAEIVRELINSRALTSPNIDTDKIQVESREILSPKRIRPAVEITFVIPILGPSPLEALSPPNILVYPPDDSGDRPTLAHPRGNNVTIAFRIESENELAEVEKQYKDELNKLNSYVSRYQLPINNFNQQLSTQIENALDAKIARLKLCDTVPDQFKLPRYTPPEQAAPTEKSGPDVAFFLDTNYFLHFKPPTEIDWPKLLDTKNVELRLCHQVLDELNKIKRDREKQPRLRKRARNLMPQIRHWAENKDIRKGVKIALDARPARINYDAHDLDRNEGDDRVLASVFEYIESGTAARVVVGTDDINLQLRCKTRGIEVFPLPEEIEIPDTAGDLAPPARKEAREAREALATFIPPLRTVLVQMGMGAIDDTKNRFSSTPNPLPPNGYQGYKEPVNAVINAYAKMRMRLPDQMRSELDSPFDHLTHASLFRADQVDVYAIESIRRDLINIFDKCQEFAEELAPSR